MDAMDIFLKIILPILNLLILGFGGVLWWLFKKLDGRIEKVEAEMQLIKNNYLTRFERVFECFSEIKQMQMKTHTMLEGLIKSFDEHCEKEDKQ